MSATYREHFMKRKNMKWFMKDHFELGIFCKSKRSCNNPNMLGQLINSVVDSINARLKLPRIMVIIIEKDFIEELKPERDTQDVTITATLYGTWLEWLAKEVMDAIRFRFDQLPAKARKSLDLEPMVYWTAIPNHMNYSYYTRVQIAKFNNCLDSVMKLHENMRMVKIKKDWFYEDANLVTPMGRITHDGIDQLWESIDSSIEFNYNKRVEFLAKGLQGKKIIEDDEQKLTQPEDPMYRFFERKKNPGRSQSNVWSGRQSKAHFEDRRYYHPRNNRGRGGSQFWLPRVK